MESMQLTTQLLIRENMPHMTAFSALPHAPVQPVVDRRRVVRRTFDLLARRPARVTRHQRVIRHRSLAA